jgi:hypothetical protein
MAGPTLNPQQVDNLLDQLNTLAAGAFTLRVYLKQQPTTKQSAVLNDEATIFQWAATLAMNLAQNTENVRDAIRSHDQIYEQETWPQPSYMPSATPDELLKTIIVWSYLDGWMFKAILDTYSMLRNPSLPPPPGPPGLVQHARCQKPHEAFNELALNAVDFIQGINNLPDYKYQKIPYVDAGQLVAPPDGSASPDSLTLSLAILELAMHRLVQAHMQIATFMPAHLRFTGYMHPLFK